MRPVERMKVVKAVRTDRRDDLYHTTDGFDFIYENPGYTKVDVVKPGFFNIYRDELRVGMMVECRLGPIADGITQVWLQVITKPLTEPGGDVEVSVGASRKFTPARTDGTLEEDEQKEQAA